MGDKQRDGVDRRQLLAGGGSLALGLALNVDTASAGEVESHALEYLAKRGFGVRHRGAVLEITSKHGHVAGMSATPRFAESGLGGLKDTAVYHSLKLIASEKCRPFLVGQIGALRQVLIVPKDGISEIKRTGVHHRFYYDDALGLVGTLGNMPKGFAYQIDDQTGQERRVMDPESRQRLSQVEREGKLDSLEKMPGELSRSHVIRYVS